MPSINPNSSQSGPPHGMEMGGGDSSPHSHHLGMAHLDPSGRQGGPPPEHMMGYGGGSGGGGYPGFGGPSQQGPYGGGGGPPTQHQSYGGPYPPVFPPPYGNAMYNGSGTSVAGGGSQYPYGSYGGPPPTTGRGGPPPPQNWYGYNPASGSIAPELPHRTMPPTGGFPTQQALPSQLLQQQQSSRSTRGGRAMAGKLPFVPVPGKAVKSMSPERADVAKENKPGDNVNPSTTKSATSKMDDLEAERMKNAEQAELSLQEVKPIQTDFHFFVLDMRDKLKVEAEEEVRKSTKKSKGEELDAFLVNTNLNSRLMKAWEDLADEERDMYVQKEEQDRRRFMEEDEVASRHCFTLTARLRADMKRPDGSSEEKQEESPSSATGAKDEKQASSEEKPSAPKEESVEADDKKTEASPETKRSQEGGETTEDSPTKKTKVEQKSE